MTTVTADRDTIIEEIEIAAPLERVFAAISDPVQLTQWWQEEGASRIEHWKWDLVRGARWNARWSGMKGEVYVLSGEIVEIDPPRVLAYTWESTWLGHPTSLVRWELRAVAGGTRVKVTHSGLRGHQAAIDDYGSGWPKVVVLLKQFTEPPAAKEEHKTS